MAADRLSAPSASRLARRIIEIVGDRGRSASAAVVRFVKRLRDQRVGDRSQSGTRDDDKAAHIAE